MGNGNVVKRLQRWYARHCDGDWEHDCGVSIESCDNPGWWVKVYLRHTAFESADFPRMSENVNEAGFPLGRRWFDCSVMNGQWQGAVTKRHLSEYWRRF
jgi:hypothetical protein